MVYNKPFSVAFCQTIPSVITIISVTNTVPTSTVLIYRAFASRQPQQTSFSLRRFLTFKTSFLTSSINSNNAFRYHQHRLLRYRHHYRYCPHCTRDDLDSERRDDEGGPAAD